MKPGNQYEFFKEVELVDGKIQVDVTELPKIIDLLSKLVISIGNIEEKQTELINIVDGIEEKQTELINIVDDINKKIDNINCDIIKCNTKINSKTCDNNNIPELVGRLYNYPNGRKSHSVQKGTVFKWGGWNIVK